MNARGYRATLAMVWILAGIWVARSRSAGHEILDGAPGISAIQASQIHNEIAAEALTAFVIAAAVSVVAWAAFSEWVGQPVRRTADVEELRAPVD